MVVNSNEANEFQSHISRRIETWERELDALVYELYGLTEGEIAIAEGRNH